MTLRLLFWVLMLLWLVLGALFAWPNYHMVGAGLVIFLLFLVLGWQVFGPPVQRA